MYSPYGACLSRSDQSELRIFISPCVPLPQGSESAPPVGPPSHLRRDKLSTTEKEELDRGYACAMHETATQFDLCDHTLWRHVSTLIHPA